GGIMCTHCPLCESHESMVQLTGSLQSFGVDWHFLAPSQTSSVQLSPSLHGVPTCAADQSVVDFAGLHTWHTFLGSASPLGARTVLRAQRSTMVAVLLFWPSWQARVVQSSPSPHTRAVPPQAPLSLHTPPTWQRRPVSQARPSGALEYPCWLLAGMH